MLLLESSNLSVQLFNLVTSIGRQTCNLVLETQDLLLKFLDCSLELLLRLVGFFAGLFESSLELSYLLF